MYIRLLAGGLAIAVASVMGYGVYQIIPMGEPLARSEVVGELDGPELASYSRVSMQRYGERQLLIGQLLVTAKEVAGLARAPVLDTQVPALRERLEQHRRDRAVAGATTALVHGDGNLALMMLQAGKSTIDTRNLIYGGRGTGVFELLGSISGDTGVTLIGTPKGETLYLVTGTIRNLGEGEQPAAWDALRSDDLGATWTYDPDVTLGIPQQHTVFLTPDLAVALEQPNDDSGMHLLYSRDGARRWSAISLKEQVWPDSAAFERGFFGATEGDRSVHGADQLAYEWSLYPLDEKRAVGWSWRMRVGPGVGERTEVIQTRRFEVLFQEGESPAFRITPDVPPVPAQAPYGLLTRDQPVFETGENVIYELDKAGMSWIERSISPKVRGTRSRIGQAWFGRNVWVIKTYTDYLFSRRDSITTYFYTRDQGKTWIPFQLSDDQARGLLGLDQTGDALLSLAEQGGKTVIRRYPLD